MHPKLQGIMLARQTIWRAQPDSSLGKVYLDRVLSEEVHAEQTVHRVPACAAQFFEIDAEQVLWQRNRVHRHRQMLRPKALGRLPNALHSHATTQSEFQFACRGQVDDTDAGA
jgi:hypothetical protein